MPSVISGDANVSATEFGYLDGVTSALQTQLDAKLPLAGGKILQIVRATDSTQRNTTSTTFTDVTGMSVTITPQKSDSAIIIWALFNAHVLDDSNDYHLSRYQLTDNSNNALSGAEDTRIGTFRYVYNAAGPRIYASVSLVGYSTPATTSATTYKLRFLSDDAGTTTRVANNQTTGQMYAIEVSA